MRITVALLRDLEKQVSKEEISYSRMVEILNETAAMPGLHPSITHINASPEFLSNPESVKALNKMVDLAYKMSVPSKGKKGMEKLSIYRFQADNIEDAFRIVARVLKSDKKTTSLDRDVMQCWGMIKNVLTGEIDKHVQR